MKKINISQLKNIFKKVFSLSKKTWIFTVLFFVIIFGFSLWVWWDCILNPLPSEEVILETNKEKQQFEIKRNKIDQVIQKIQERRTRFEQAVDHQLNRKIFKSKEEIFEEMNTGSQSTNSSGINRLP